MNLKILLSNCYLYPTILQAREQTTAAYPAAISVSAVALPFTMICSQ